MVVPVQFQNVTKCFGKVCAVQNLTFEVHTGECLVLLGQNGAGKTTTLRLLLGLIHPSQGEIFLFQQSPQNNKTRKKVGYLPGEMGWPLGITAGEWLKFLGEISGNPNPKRRFELLEQLEFPIDRLKSYIGTLSQGMKRKLGIVTAMEPEPELLILDEPSEGLDPVQQRNLLELLKKRPNSMSLLLSSHNLREVIELSNRIAIYCNGTIRAILPNQFTTTDELETVFFQTIER